jgi:hypothetical protein
VTSKPYQKLVLFRDFQTPNPRLGANVLCRFREREQPGVPVFGGVNSTLVMSPNKSVCNIFIKPEVGNINGVSYVLRQSGIEDISVLTGSGEDIFNSEMKVVYVDDRDKGTKVTMMTPVAEPKRGIARTWTPMIPCFEDVLCSNN